MLYKKLAELYEKIGSTTKRLEKIDILSKFFEFLSEEDREVIYLLEGNIYPEYDERRIGISNQLAIKSISKSTGIDAKKVLNEWKKIGDLGEVAKKLTSEKKQRTLASSVLTTKKVLENLRKLPELEGKGTVDKKISIITELLTSAEPIEALYLTRTLIGDLRIGTQESTIRESLAKAFFKNPKEMSEKIQGAIDKSNDLAEVFDACKKKNLKSLEKISLQVGKPIKAMLAQKAPNIEGGFKALGTPCACFPKGELIFSNPSLKKIEELKENNLVIGKNGQSQKILKTFKRNYKGELIKIFPNYLFPFSLTPEHRILVIKKQLCSWKNRLIMCRPNCQEQKYGCKKHYKNYEIEWIPAREIKPRDFILFPKFREFQIIDKMELQEYNKNKEIEVKSDKIRSNSKLKGVFKGKWVNRYIKLTNEFFELCGWYLAEGDADERGCIRFSLGYNEEQEAKRIKELIKKVFGIDSRINTYPKKGIRIIRTNSNLIANFFRKSFDTKSINKRIPSFIMFAEAEKIKPFIKAYIQGDGHKSKSDVYTIVTASKSIAYQIILLLSKINILPSVGRYENKGFGNIQYRIAIYGKQINNIEENKHKTKTHHKRFFQDENFFYIPIRKLESQEYKGFVFNLETPDNTYLSSAIVHNCEYKYDGFRLIIHKKNSDIILFTRSLENVTKQFPEVVEYIKEFVKGSSFILDSEAVGYDKKTKEYLSFQHISQRIRRKYHIEELQKKLPVEINVFDVLYYNGKSFLEKPFEERTKLLRKIIIPHPYKIIPSKMIITSDKKEVEKFYNQALKDNQEGVMMKNLKAPYKPGRRVGNMLKIKPEEKDLDLVITGAEHGKGKRSGWLSSFILSCKGRKFGEYLEIGKVGTGIVEKEESKEENAKVSFSELTEKIKPLIEKEDGKRVYIKPKIIVAVTYQEIQKSPNYNSGWALRFPRITTLRPDKSLSEIADLKEIEKDFSNQKRNWKYG